MVYYMRKGGHFSRGGHFSLHRLLYTTHHICPKCGDKQTLTYLYVLLVANYFYTPLFYKYSHHIIITVFHTMYNTFIMSKIELLTAYSFLSLHFSNMILHNDNKNYVSIQTTSFPITQKYCELWIAILVQGNFLLLKFADLINTDFLIQKCLHFSFFYFISFVYIQIMPTLVFATAFFSDIYIIIWGFTSLSTLYRSYHDG